jgi:hypothetical protein
VRWTRAALVLGTSAALLVGGATCATAAPVPRSCDGACSPAQDGITLDLDFQPIADVYAHVGSSVELCIALLGECAPPQPEPQPCRCPPPTQPPQQATPPLPTPSRNPASPDPDPTSSVAASASASPVPATPDPPRPRPTAVVLTPPQKKSQKSISLAAQSPATAPLSTALIPRTPHIIAIAYPASAKPTPTPTPPTPSTPSHSTQTVQQLPSALLLHPPAPPTRHGLGLLTVVFLVVVVPISLARLRR